MLSPPTIDGRSLTEFLDEPDRILEALINWRLSSADDKPPSDDPDRVRMIEARINKALAAAAGVALNVTAGAPLLIPGNKTTFAVNLTNSGTKPLQITRLSLNAWGKELAADVPDHLLPDTDTSAALDAETPPTTPYTIPKADHLYDQFAFGIPIKARAEIDIEAAKFQVTTQTNLDVAPAVEIKKASPSPCVRTEETLGRCKLLTLTLSNHLATPFRGTIRANVSSSSSAHTFEVKRQLVLGPLETRDEPLFADNPIPDRENLRELQSSGSVVISISRSPNDSITERTVSVIYADARVANELHVGYVPSFDQTLASSLAALGVEAKALSVEEIQNTELASFDAVIIDNRAYEAQPELDRSQSAAA